MEYKSIPLWKLICDEICNDITSGKYPKGSLLPTEMEMTAIYDVSRITIRAALDKIAKLGLIKRIKGKGTLVMLERIKEPLLKIPGFTEEMQKDGMIPATDYAEVQFISPTSFIADLFEINDNNKCFLLKRVRSINDVQIGYFENYLCPDIASLLELDNSLYYGSLYDTLAEKGIVIDHISLSIGAELVDKKTMQMLNMVKGEAMMVVKRCGYMNDKIVEFSVCKYDGKRYEYKMEL